MKPFRVAGYDADQFTWKLVAEFRTPAEAVTEFHVLKADRRFQFVAAARVVGLEIELLECDSPSAENLKSDREFVTTLANPFTPLPRRKKPPAVTTLVTCLSEPEVIGLYARLAQRGVIVG
ncbi:MAG: hypothetical protein C0467_22730 [Planctomycetaceae bacterium]|nr:hypothetical protein [Planctomycetaceae bacterium]